MSAPSPSSPSMLILAPFIGVTSWKELSDRANIGSVVIVASSAVSVGQALVDTGAANWLTKADARRAGRGTYATVDDDGRPGGRSHYHALCLRKHHSGNRDLGANRAGVSC